MSNHTSIHATAVDYNPFAASLPAIEVDPIAAQLAMWLSCRAQGGADAAHKESVTVEIAGEVNDPALIRAIQTLPAFHEALRGHFRKDGQRFIIEPRIDVPVAHFDLSAAGRSGWMAEVRRLIELDCTNPFHLEFGPLFRVTIMRVEPQLRVVVLTAHQAVCDGWSMDVVLADLGRLYSAFVGSQPLPTPPKHSFCEYLRYRDTPEMAKRIRASKTFWRESFKATPGLPDSQHPGRPLDAHACPSSSAALVIRPELVREVKAFASGQDLSPFAVLLSAFSILVSRILESRNFTLAVPVAGQPEAGMEDCVGPLASVVPVRCRFDPSQSFEARCRDSYHAILDAREQSGVDIRALARATRAEDDAFHVPFPAVALSHVQKYAPGKLVFGDCKIDYQLNAPAFDEFGISLVVFEAQDTFTLDLRGDSESYGQEWLAQRLEEYERILDFACNSPRATVETIASLAYNATSFAGGYPRGASCKYYRKQEAETKPEVALNHSDDGLAAVRAPAGKQSGLSPDLSPDISPDISRDQSPIIVTLQPGQADKVPLLLLFGIELYIDLAMAITDGTPVIAMHIPIPYEPARSRRPPLSEVIARYTAAVREVRPVGPYSIAGLCFGGIVAYEVARSLRQQGEEVALVAVFDSVLPRGRHVDRRERLGYLLGKALTNPSGVLWGALKERVAARATWLVRLPVAKEFGRRLVTWSTGQDPTKTIDLPVLGNEAKADVANLEMSRPYLDAPLLVFRATRDETPPGETTDPDCGWSGFARSVQSYGIESDHLNIVRWPHATVLARAIMGNKG